MIIELLAVVEDGRRLHLVFKLFPSLGDCGFWETGDRRRGATLPVTTTYLHALLVSETGFCVLPVFSLFAGGMVLKASLVGREPHTAADSWVRSLN